MTVKVDTAKKTGLVLLRVALSFLIPCAFLAFVGISSWMLANENLGKTDNFDTNETASWLEGEGTDSQPYLIQSANDLAVFRNAVNNGTEFEGVYFQQTADIDLASFENWVPIGILTSSKVSSVFRGQYDGRGHVLRNLIVSTDGFENNNALFGFLGGTVKNLGIESGWIKGQCAGSIASHGSGTIINCYNKATVSGFNEDSRAGGIADNFSGAIISCVNLGEVHSGASGLTGGICSYSAGRVENCYATDPLISEAFVGVITDSITLDVVSVSTAIDRLNYYAEFISPESDLCSFRAIDENSINFAIEDIGSPSVRHAYRVQFCVALATIFATLMISALMLHQLFRKKMVRTVHVFIALMAVGYLVYWLIFLISNGDVTSCYFIEDPYDSFMDLYNPMKKEIENTYTEPYHSNYPPLANLLFLFFRLFIPQRMIGGDYYSLETGQASVIVLLLILVASIISLFVLLREMAGSDCKPVSGTMLTAVVLLSGPFLFLYERANNLLFVLVFLIVFFLFYQDENRLRKELALLSLGIAIGLKLYFVPVILLLVVRKDYRSAIRCLIYGVALVFLPFIFYDGLTSALDFISNILSRDSSPFAGLGYSFSVTKVAEILSTAVFFKTVELTAPVLYLAPLGICAVIFIAADTDWKRILAVLLLIIWLPSNSHTYMLCLLVIPLLLFLRSDRQRTFFDRIYLICFIGIFSLYALPPVGLLNDLVAGRNLTYGMLCMHMSIWLLAITLVAEIVFMRLSKQIEKRLSK